LVLFVVDGSAPFTGEDEMILEAIGSKSAIVVRNKSDLPTGCELPAKLVAPCVAISTMTGAGISDLRQAIHTCFIHGKAVDGREFVAVSRARHRDALDKSLKALQHFVGNL